MLKVLEKRLGGPGLVHHFLKAKVGPSDPLDDDVQKVSGQRWGTIHASGQIVIVDLQEL